MEKNLTIAGVYWDGFQQYWLNESGEKKPLTVFQVDQLLMHFKVKFLAEYFPAEILIRVSPKELQAEETLSSWDSIAGEDDDDSLTTYFWDRRKNTWMIDVNPENDDEHKPNPHPISSYDLDDLLLKQRLHHFDSKNGDEEFLQKILHLPPEQLRLL